MWVIPLVLEATFSHKGYLITAGVFLIGVSGTRAAHQVHATNYPFQLRNWPQAKHL